MTEAQKWLESREECNTKEKREEVKKLDISKHNLEGELDLRDFTNLEELDCSQNKLSVLDLTNCQNLIELKCQDNELEKIKLTTLPHLKIFQAWTNNLNNFNWESFNPEVLNYISISNNNFSKQDLTAFSNFTNLEELYLGNDVGERLGKSVYNRFYGSLEALKDLKKLKKIQIEVTKIKEEFEYLPSDSQIISWSWHKQNGMIAKIVPLERLYVIRGNLKQFLRKWGAKKENESSELSKLKSPYSPDELWRDRLIIYGIQFIGHGSAVAGAALTFKGYSNEGAGILAIYPFAELIISKLEENLKNRENKWKEFLTDADTFLDNYNELSGILDQFEINDSKKGKVNKAIGDLSEKNKGFLSVYDGASGGEKDGEIDINELITKRNELVKDLDKGREDSEAWGMIDAIKELEKSIIEYRKFSYYEEMLWYEDYEDNNQGINKSQSIKDEQLETKIEVDPYQNK